LAVGSGRPVKTFKLVLYGTDLRPDFSTRPGLEVLSLFERARSQPASAPQAYALETTRRAIALPGTATLPEAVT
jgi:hypothetical protein